MQPSQASAFDHSQRAILERIANKAPLAELLDQIVRAVEQQAEGMLCTILLLDANSQRLRHGAAPSISPAYVAAINGSAIGPGVGSCGTAAYTGKRVTVEDIASHPYWINFRDLALAAGLKACWSTPILSHAQAVLGTFAMYYREPRGPTADEISWVDAAVHLASVAINHENMESELRASERRFRQIVETAFEGVWQIDNQSKTIFANDRMAKMLGYSVDELLQLSVYDLSHADDRQYLQVNLEHRIDGVSEQHDWRFIRKDGSELWCIVAGTPTYDAQGNVIGSLGMITDITARKQAEDRLRSITRLYAVSSSVNEALVRIREPRALYDYACRIAVEQGELSFAWVAVRDSADAPLELVAYCGGNVDFVKQVMERVNSTPVHPGPAGRALRDGVPAVANDIATDPQFFFKDAAISLGMKSCAVFPVKREHFVHGIFAIYSKQKDYFRDEELRVLTALAEDISFAVESADKQRALQEHERMMETLFGNLPGLAYRRRNDAFWTCDLISAGCFELTGYTQASFLGNSEISYERVIYPLDREMVRTHVEAALAGKKPFELVYRIMTAQGAHKWVWERGTGVFDEQGELRFIEGFITDVTARREAEDQVAAQAALLDKATDAIVLYGLDDSVYFWNQGAQRLYGWSAAEAVGQKITQLTCRDSVQRRALIARLLEHGEWSGELTHITKSGAEVIVDASWTLVRDDIGRPRSILAINTDITERKKLETQFLTTQRMESIGTLAGGIAHDFNNILTAISGNTKLATADLPSNHPLQTPLHEIEKASLRASELVRQILTFSRRQETKRQVVKLRDIVGEALRLLRATLPAQIDIQAHYDDDIPQIAADATQIHQVVINLGTNAAHALREHGGMITVRVEAIVIADVVSRVVSQGGHSDEYPRDLRPGRYARLTVSDTGTGMDAATRERIFEPFFTTKPPGQGTGLGLSVVHGIVRSHDGAITVRSEPGRGSSFASYFPQTTERMIDTPPQSPVTAAVSGGGQRVLYVDDEEALVFLTTRVLERMGYHVTGRVDAKQALEEFRRDPLQFDAVVSDLSMPGMTGPELARAMLAIRPDIPIVLTSGYIRDEDMKIVRDLKIRGLVLKPNTVEDLGATLHQVLAEAGTEAGAEAGASN